MVDSLTHDLTNTITGFLTKIGIDVVFASVAGETFLPGILVENGKLIVDEAKLKHPGDLLHEAGHLAMAPAGLREQLSGEVNLPDVNLDALESQVIAWSYAAAVHLNLDPKMVFHDEGYKGKSEAILLNFQLGVYIGVNGLEEAGMAASADKARELGVLPYPHVLKWLKD